MSKKINGSRNVYVNENISEVEKSRKDLNNKVYDFFAGAVNKITSKLHTLNNFNGIVKKEGDGEKHFSVEHYRQTIQPNVVLIRYGGEVYDEAMSEFAQKSHAAEEIPLIFNKVAKENYRADVASSEIIKKTAAAHGKSYGAVEAILNRAFIEAKKKNDKNVKEIEFVEELMIQYVQKVKDIQNTRLLIISEDPIKSNGSIEYLLREINPATDERLNKETDPSKLVKKSPMSMGIKHPWGDVEKYLAEYCKTNTTNNIVINVDTRDHALSLGKIIEKEKTHIVPEPEPVVAEPSHFDNSPVVITPKNNLFNNPIVKYAAIGLVGAASLFFIYKGITSTFAPNQKAPGITKSIENKVSDVKINLTDNSKNQISLFKEPQKAWKNYAEIQINGNQKMYFLLPEKGEKVFIQPELWKIAKIAFYDEDGRSNPIYIGHNQEINLEGETAILKVEDARDGSKFIAVKVIPNK